MFNAVQTFHIIFTSMKKEVLCLTLNKCTLLPPPQPPTHTPKKKRKRKRERENGTNNSTENYALFQFMLAKLA